MFQKAERRQRKARIAIFGPSGSGKTYTALSIARGLGGKVALIDTERYSASLYAGQFEFDTCDLPGHTIEAYTQAIDAAAESGYGVLIIDSLSHAWQELLAEVDRIRAQSRSGNSFQAWANATPKHKRLVSSILTYPGHIIGTMRSETAYAIETNERGKQVPVRLGLKPDQGKNIEFEFDMLIEMDVDNVGTFGKDRTGLFQGRRVEKPGEALGKEIAEWLASGAEPKSLPAVAPTGDDLDDDAVYLAKCIEATGIKDEGKAKQRLVVMAREYGKERPSEFTGLDRHCFVSAVKENQ